MNTDVLWPDRELAEAQMLRNTAVLAEGRRLLIADPARFDGVSILGVDEPVWRHTRRGDKYVCESRSGWSGIGW